jgi:LAO/AO transport system kinase
MLMPYEGLVEGVLKGDRRAISKVITIIEDDLPGAAEVYSKLFSKSTPAFVLGIAGPPGAGKSSLINCLIREYRMKGRRVGVVAIDPTSPFTGGALLGDRVRMVDHSLDDGVYIRSMASRGSVGGLSRNARKAIVVLGAAHYDVIILETVGIGQTEMDVIKVADATVMVLMPEMGDSVQAMKAGLMEIGDIFVVNKADLGGADKAAIEIAGMIKEKDGWKPPVLMTVAKTCSGVRELVEAVELYRTRTKVQDEGKKDRERALQEIREALQEKLMRMLDADPRVAGQMAAYVDSVMKRELDPCSAADKIFEALYGKRVRSG